MFSAMLSDAFRDGDTGINIHYRTTGSLFNLCRLQVKTEIQKATIQDFLFADNCALNASKQSDRQRSLDKFSAINFKY